MSNQHSAIPAASVPEPGCPFTPVPVRPRHDGWTPGKQVAFIHALAETACVDEACRRVGMSQQSAYMLRTRPDAVSFRQAWVVALDHGAAKLADRAMARAMNGVVVPIFYQGQKVGEKHVFNERLTMFLLRAHAPEKYGAWRDRTVQTREHPDGLSVLFKHAVRAVAEDALADEAGRPRPQRDLLAQAKLTLGAADDDDRNGAYERMEANFQHAWALQEEEIAELRHQLAERESGCPPTEAQLGQFREG